MNLNSTLLRKMIVVVALAVISTMQSLAQDMRKYEQTEGYKLSVKEGVLSKISTLNITRPFSDTSGYDFHTHHYKGINVPFSSVTDETGNVYVTGTSSDYESVRGNFVTIKVSPEGNLLWEHKEPGVKYASEIGMETALGADGNPISAGIVWNGHDMDLLTVKYNAGTGDVIWQNTYSGTADGMDVPAAITVSPDGTIAIAGITYTGSNISWLVMKLDPEGTLLWSNVVENPLSDSWIEPTSIYTDVNGNIGVTGYNGNSEYWSCYYTVVYSASGTTLWSNLYEDENALNVNSTARSITADASGNWYVTGTFDTFNPEMRTLNYSSTGTLLWTDSYIMTEELTDGYSILTAPGDKIYAAGRHFGSWVDDGWIVISYNDDGSREWSNISNDLIDVRPVQMTLDEAGYPVIAGWGTDPETWNNIIKGTKYSPTGEVAGAISYLQMSSEFGGFTDFLKLAVDGSDNAYLTFTGFYTNLGSAFEVMKMPFATGTMEWDYKYSNESASRTELLTAWADGMNNTYVTGRYDSITDNYLLSTYILVKYNSTGDVEWEKEFNEFNGNASNGIMARVTPTGDVVTYLLPNYGEPLKLKKYNSSGDLIWEVEKSTINGSFNTFFIDNSGNIYLGGSAFKNESDLTAKFAVLKYSPAGEELWYNFAVRDGYSDDAFNLLAGTADAAGNTYYTGNAGTGGWFDQAIDIVALKFNPAGELQWIQSFPQEGYNTSGRNLIVNSAGDIYINGHREDKVTYEQQMIVLRLNADGSINWSEIYEDPGRRVMSYKAVQLSTGELIVSGFSVVDGLNNKVILVKFNESGDFLNVTETPYDRFFYDMYLDGADNLIVLNQVAGTTYPFRPYYSAGGMPIAGLFKLHADGTTEEELTYGPELSDYYPAMLVPLNDGRLLIAGTLSNEFSMFQGIYFFEDEHVVSVNNPDVVTDNLSGQNMPNPASDYTYIPVNLKKNGNVSITIFDLTGRKIEVAFSGRLPEGNNLVKISTSKENQGIYLYEVVADELRQSYRMMIK